MRKTSAVARLALLTALLTIWPLPVFANDKDLLYQVSTINALLEGVYDGETTFGALTPHGGFGLGTFNRLDGEMVLLDGVVYQIKTDGKAYKVKSGAMTPFAMVTWFESDISGFDESAMDSEKLKARLDSMIDSKNLIYAVKISGSFKYLKLRSVPAQSKPYPKLKEVIASQVIFEHSMARGASARGTIVGFRIPESVKGANSPGYHFHFISESKDFGGHVLALKTGKVKIELDRTNRFMMTLPDDEEFLHAGQSVDSYKPMESEPAR